MTIIPYFDPILGKLRNSDVALISLATLIVTDPVIVNNLIVNSNATIYGTLRTNSLVNSSTISTKLINTNGIIASTATVNTAHISNIEWNLTSGATGWVTTFGEITGLNLSSFTAGNTLYLSGVTAGYYTNVPTKAPTHYVRLGTVVKATTDGSLVVNVINGYELDELHNVVIASLASGQILISGASQLWYNKSLTSVLPPSVSALASLSDVALVSLASGNYLKYNGVNWTNDDVFINIDGGSANAVYLISQNINGGNA